MGNYIMWVKKPFVENKLRVTLPVFALCPQRQQEIPQGVKRVPCLLPCSPYIGAGDSFYAAEGLNTLTGADPPGFTAHGEDTSHSSEDGFKRGMSSDPLWPCMTPLYILISNDLL